MLKDSENRCKNVAVILAGGTGSRLGASTPKQFFKVAGKMVIEHTIVVFEHHRSIDEIAIVVHPDYMDKMEEIVLKNHWSKVKKILKGGAERYHSSLSAIRAYDSDSEVNLIFHDAVRPLVTHQIIDDVIAALENIMPLMWPWPQRIPSSRLTRKGSVLPISLTGTCFDEDRHLKPFVWPQSKGLMNWRSKTLSSKAPTIAER